MEHNLRKATAEDRNAIFHTKKDSIFPYVEKIWGWDEEYQRLEFNTDFAQLGQFEVIEADGKYAGFVQSFEDEKCIQLCEIHLLTEFRGKGIGSSIIGGMLKAAEKENKKVGTGCFKENCKAKALYLRLGFVQVGETQTHDILVYSV